MLFRTLAISLPCKIQNDQTTLMRRGQGYTRQDAAKYWASLEESGRAAENRLDLIFPFVYGGALLTGMLLAWALLGRPFSPAVLVAA